MCLWVYRYQGGTSVVQQRHDFAIVFEIFQIGQDVVDSEETKTKSYSKALLHWRKVVAIKRKTQSLMI